MKEYIKNNGEQMNREKINQMIENFSKKYGFITGLNNENVCNLVFQGNEKLNIEYIEDSDRVIIYTYLLEDREQSLTFEQKNLILDINAELFAKTGGIITLHTIEKTPILCWGCDAEVLQETDFNNVLENITALTNIAREKIEIIKSHKISFNLNNNNLQDVNIEDFKFSSDLVH